MYKIVRSLIWGVGLTGVFILLFYPFLDVHSLYTDLGDTFDTIPTEEKKSLEKPLTAMLLEEVGNGEAEYLTASDTFLIHYKINIWEMMFSYKVKISEKEIRLINELIKRHMNPEEIEFLENANAMNERFYNPDPPHSEYSTGKENE